MTLNNTNNKYELRNKCHSLQQHFHIDFLHSDNKINNGKILKIFNCV